jgi:YXWGXW repeat-containing protein
MRGFRSEPFHEPDRVLQTSHPEVTPFHPRNPQQQSIIGHAKDYQAKGITMRIISSIRSTLFALVVLAMSGSALAQISLSISFAPPELPIYEQPLCPGDGYLWTPGYWAYSDDDYYFVPGTWVMAPEPGLLWTPAYWGWGGNGFVFNEGYWGEHVGFYGGISYGYGYFGDGYQGGHWQGREFYYNRSVSNVNIVNIHNVYNTTIINTNVTRVSYNGGSGGIVMRPRPEEEAAAREKHTPPVAAQAQHEQSARSNPEQRASVNHGTPQVAATPKPGAFSEAVHAKATGTPYTPPVRAAVQPPANTPATHPGNNVARPETNRPTSEPTRQPEPSKTEANKPEPPRPETNRPATAQPAQPAEPNDRPEPNRTEPAQRQVTPAPSERPQPERTSPPAETRPETQQHPQPAPLKAEEQNQQNGKPKQNAKPKQDEKPKEEEKPK